VTADLPTRYADRLTVQAEMFRVAEKAGVDIDSLTTNGGHRLTLWPKTQDGFYASEASVYTLLGDLGSGPVRAKCEGVSYGSYQADLTLNGVTWTVTAYAAVPMVPDVPDAALMAAWMARGDNGCKDCVDRPCSACAAHLTGIASAVLRVGAR
jgi:hypothetical protein